MGTWLGNSSPLNRQEILVDFARESEQCMLSCLGHHCLIEIYCEPHMQFEISITQLIKVKLILILCSTQHIQILPFQHVICINIMKIFYILGYYP